MKFFFLLLPLIAFSQKTPEDFGLRHLVFTYKNDTVDVIIESKKGEETKAKPLFFWCQGSLPQPIIKYDERGLFPVFPFDSKDFLNDFHLVIIAKPAIPVIADVKNLKKNYCVLDEKGNVPLAYSDRNYLDYYADRNNFIISKLLSNPIFLKKNLIVAGHSEGSHIAARMACTNKKIAGLIYSGGNPYGRFLNIVAQSRMEENDNTIFDYWSDVVVNKNDKTYNGGDTYNCTYGFSEPLVDKIEKLKIPVYVAYGTKDYNVAYMDLFYTDVLRKN
ncbi:alpha/beta hydrolase [Flavobacterium phycosphaerae]|uniref:alpha/beta hydrolase n=1 Tax=Flavobacterium phycosphaerae TaxID=2697515 RepID=UPI00138A2291|nr:alpha/beta hydrolase [Flavobacterium phycosphaerae]